MLFFVTRLKLLTWSFLFTVLKVFGISLLIEVLSCYFSKNYRLYVRSDVFLDKKLGKFVCIAFNLAFYYSRKALICCLVSIYEGKEIKIPNIYTNFFTNISYETGVCLIGNCLSHY
jgi:hypothetical protein